MTKSSRTSPDDPTLNDVLRRHGLRRTAPRARVLRFVYANPRPMTHGEVARALAREGLDYVTVYRNLIDLAEAGILARTDLGDHVWRFELKPGESENQAAHAHFVCTDCGTVTCLPEGAVEVVAKRRMPRAVNRREVLIQLHGRCDDCG